MRMFPNYFIERRYLLLMGLRSSRIYFIDVKDDPLNPKIKKIIEPDEYQAKTGYSRPYTAHCGLDGIYVSNLGTAEGDEGPGGIALLDHDSSEIKRQWEKDYSPQYLAYDFDRLCQDDLGADQPLHPHHGTACPHRPAQRGRAS